MASPAPPLKAVLREVAGDVAELRTSALKHRSIVLEAGAAAAAGKRPRAAAAAAPGHRLPLTKARRRQLAAAAAPLKAAKLQWARDALPLRPLWLAYADRVLGACREDAAALSVKAGSLDLHGATVVLTAAASAPPLVGRAGVVVAESENTCTLLEPGGRVTVVALPHACFSFRWRGWVFDRSGADFLGPAATGRRKAQ